MGSPPAGSVAPQHITDELRRWIVAQTEAGCRPQDVVAAMQASGWAEATAVQALEQTLRQRLHEIGQPLPAPTPTPPSSPAPRTPGPRPPPQQ